MENHLKIIKGNMVFAPSFGQLETLANSYVIIEGKKIKGTYRELPAQYNNLAITDYGDALIIPGFVDLHFHAPQFANRGLGLDLELLPWLEQYTFPEEAKFKDNAYAAEIYKQVVTELWKWGTTRVALFGTIHKEATAHLMEMLALAGLGGYVGKVNMDRNSSDSLLETTEQSLADTEDFIKNTIDRYGLVKPIITPRFVPSCTGDLMSGLARLAGKYNLPVQSHLSENTGEIAWVKELHPDCLNYANVYQKFGLFGQQPTIMAHCIYNDAAEIELMAKNKVTVAHCPYSNNNLASGIAPVRKLIDLGVAVGLGSDIAGGHEISIAKVMAAAVQVSKLKWLASDKKAPFFTIPEVFFMATKGGGSFFGKVGSFEEGYEFDALVIDDTGLNVSTINRYSLAERLSRFIYIGDYHNIVARYVAGKKMEQPQF
ncbi:amidohydrolase family protein [Sporomusa acidovorans]|uniref:Guanine deaminase n=1 Tax=Sporomusa acidovorans (strain ATCC 49682 / DSM 3132 / Mol) TaxID=1123286 RepID=A0ABZ3J551_SPOA4|nr:amidohydrolase family protein [Sporomusa acidovorans]OZC15667.1 guanine deaminase [Sporomusa acidovorans DSM 3132]SDE88538.1 guanine deaminase [Sporomusa acidovorans]